MFIVIYSFHIIKGKDAEFIQVWEELTHLIAQYEGGLGSRLHQKNETTYIAYAQWPSKQQWKNSGSKLPENVREVRAKMRSICSNIEVLHELEHVKDLLKPFKA